MCGIAGIVGREVSDAVLGRAAATIAHRGPDASRIYRSGSTGFVHTRLSVIDLSSAADQPMTDPETGVTVVYNGEIYNFRELREQIGPATFTSRSDTEVILRLYLRFGIKSTAQLRGMFTFAIWDPRSASLHLSRDRFGIKPLYIHLDNGILSFASEAKALFALGVPSRFNPRMIADYLMTGRMAHTAGTFFDNIESFPPGTIMSFRDGKISTFRYWSTDRLSKSVAPGGSDDDIEVDLWECVVDTVERHLISDVPVGVSLSSGLDSQFIMHVLRHSGRDDLHAFTFGFDEIEYDEIRRTDSAGFPKSVTRHNRVIRPEEMLPAIEKAMRFYEAPLGGLGSLGAFLLMETPRQQGIPVVLSGEGSDETFGGYKYYYDAYFRDLYEAGDHDTLRHELAAYATAMGELPVDPGSSEFLQRFVYESDSLKAPDGTTLGGKAFLSPEFVESMEISASEPFGAGSHLRSTMLRDLYQQKLPKLLWFQDRASMAWGVETRVPFVDHELIEKSYCLTDRWMIRDGEAKYLPKRFLRRFCNVETQRSVKHFVAVPQREWIKDALFDDINSYLNDGMLAQSGLIDYDAFRTAYAEYAAQGDLGNSFFVWKMINLEAMLRAFPEAGQVLQ